MSVRLRRCSAAFLATSGLLLSGGQQAMAGAEQLRPLPGGVVFPGYNEALTANPGAMPLENVSAFEALAQPKLFGATTYDYGASLVYTSSSFGLGAGITGTQSPATDYAAAYSDRTAHLGAGLRFNDMAIGATYSPELGTADSTGLATTSALDLGIIIGDGKATNFGVVVRDMNSTPYMTVGAGYGEKKYYLEADLTLPSFSTGLFADGASYTLQLSASAYAGIFGLSFSTSVYHSLGYAGDTSPPFYKRPLTLSHGVSALVRLGKPLNLTLRSNLSSQVIFGLQLVFL
jgi:hypothetical protein